MHKKTIIDFKQLGQRLIFTNPIKELKTRRLDQVKELLTEIEGWQEKGYYAVGYVSYEAAPAFEESFRFTQLRSRRNISSTLLSTIRSSRLPFP